MEHFAPQDSKVGSFDWITEFDGIERYLEPLFIGLDHIPKEKIRVLVAGCGTSKLSAELADKGFGSIVSVDNDTECIAHMKRMHSGDERLQWFTYDMVDPEASSASLATRNGLGTFEMIVDKGTLDAILVEGAIYMMLHEVHRLLKVDGVYIVFSLNTEMLLAPLLGIASLGFDVQCHKICKRESFEEESSQSDIKSDLLGTAVICKKRKDDIVDIEKLAEEEKAVMDNYFQIEKPFLTADQRQKIRENFECAFLAIKKSDSPHEKINSDRPTENNENWSLPLFSAYNAIFESEEALEYSFELFSEDIAQYPLEREGSMTVSEALSFLEMMQ